MIHYANEKDIVIIPDFDMSSHLKYWMTHLKDDVDIWNNSLTTHGLSYFDMKPHILYWKPVTLTLIIMR